MGLQVWLPLNGNLNNNGISPVTVTNNGATVNTSGKIGSCYYLSGGYMTTPIDIDNTNFTVMAWLKYTAFVSGSNTYAVCLNSSSSSDFQISLGSLSSALAVRYNGTTTSLTASSLDTWYHIAATYNGTSIKVYTNGILTNTINVSSVSKATKLTLGGRNASTTGNPNAYINDVRIYDECLSDKEIKEISKGLVLHYPLCDEYAESTTNIVPSPYKTSYPSYSPGWDTTKHLNAVSVANWGSGYNGGVSNPDTGYHAMWNIIDGIPTVVYQNHNSEISQKGRWMGVSCGLSTSITSAITAGTKYTISFDIKSIDNTGGYCTSGIYYKLTSSATSASFHDGCPSFGTITKVGEWKRVSYTFTRVSGFDGNTLGQSIYIYGMYGTESTIYVRNVQIEIKDHATPYVISSRSAYVYDTSGYEYNGTITGTLNVLPNSARNNKCTFWPTATTYTNSIHTPIIYSSGEAITMSIWVKTTTVGGQSYQMPFESNSGAYCEMSITSGGALRGGLYVNGTRYVTNVGSGLLDGNWHMISITYDGTTIRRYIDAVEYASTSVTGTLSATSQSYWFGVLGTDTAYYNSNIYESDARLYATALSADDIKSLYNNPIEITNNGSLMTQGEIVEE